MVDAILKTYLARTPGSAALAVDARDVIAGGVVTDTRVFDPYGIYVDRAMGTTKWDVDGNAYLDFFGGHGANMLGHAHPELVKAISQAAGRGSQYAANTPYEVALAKEVVRHVPTAEVARFTGSGTEATLLAMRIARAWTGRSKIVRFASHYHGWHDHAASGYAAQFDGSPATGILAGIAMETILLPPGDSAALARAVERFRDDIAAFIIEPVGTHFGVVPVKAEFLREVQAAARAAGALFILDEVLSGFRVALGGAQSVMGLSPDLTTLAKVLCGGMPGGAVVGRQDVLSVLDIDAGKRSGREKVLHQGTFTANPLSMLAGLKMLQILEQEHACDTVNRLGALARERLKAMCDAEGLPFLWYGEFSICHMLITPDPWNTDIDTLARSRFLERQQPVLGRLRMAMNNAGVDVNTKGSALFSAVHDETDIDTLVESVAQAGHDLRADGLIERKHAAHPLG